MKICYYDESGDDGFPSFSSPIFVLSALYFDYSHWKIIHEQIRNFRRELKEQFNFPVKLELHSKYFLLDKDPYRNMGFDVVKRKLVISLFCKFIGSLDIRIVNILINKQVIRSPNFDVLNTALTYSIQRIENDIDLENNPKTKFLIITDDGRVDKMRKTTRSIQKINYVPSKFGYSPLRKDIKSLIEDPLPKNSKESYFIQITDLVAYIVYLYGIKMCKAGDFPSRLKKHLTDAEIKDWLNLLKPSLNLNAAQDNEFGIKIQPRS
ncbi:DUF3800 domain-containing protein [Nitrosomonas marina]|uniref:DUF3800 domain-containing protein n=1 Tax=Nitrosomonas marina TaxID=917 RepID=A0A1H8GFC1_9PROT|nr:DUF3800 domain-containing protein [Nitrosomonas marina]SEN42841.1 Protein of unknown function [Nitrosomonas marina]